MTLFALKATIVAALLSGMPSADESTSAAQPVRVPQNRTAPTAAAQNPRIMFIAAADSTHCTEELARLRQPGGEFEKLESQGWKIGPGPECHLQIVDRSSVPELVKQIEARDFPIIVCIDDKEIVRSFRTGCTTPLDAWTFGWLAKGVSERPTAEIPEVARVESTNNYPLRGNHWSIDEDWNPTRERVIGHLRGPNHGSQISPEWNIESWSYEELRSLHDNLHEQLMGGASYAKRSGGSQRASNGFAGKNGGS